METLSTVQQRLNDAGFVEDFAARPGLLHATPSGQDFDPRELVATEMVRFEGNSDPDDEALLVALSTSAGDPVGTFTVPYGPSISADEASALRHLQTNRHSDHRSGLHDSHHHLAAVFGSSEAAEAAVAELREQGLGSEHLGVAVHGVDHVVFENDEEVDLEHAAERDAARGAALGFLGGMLVFGLAVPGIGALGVGGILALGASSAFGGAMIGGYVGIAETSAEFDEHEQFRHTRLKDDEVLVVACAHEQADVVKAAFTNNGGRLTET